MCGRTSLFVPESVLEARFDAEFVHEFVPRYNIAPREDLATIRNTDSDKINLLQWGLLPSWVDDPADSPRPINARAETVDEKPMFRSAFNNRRCLILADGFYEWHGDPGNKQPYRVTRPDGEPFAMAGLWEIWDKNGRDCETVTIITIEANKKVGEIHDRMPVILEPDEEEQWLTELEASELRSVLDPYPDELTKVYPVSTAVNDPANDSPQVIEEIDI